MKPAKINSATPIEETSVNPPNNNAAQLQPYRLISLQEAYALIDRSGLSASSKEKYKQHIVHFINFTHEYGLQKNSLLLFEQQLNQPIFKEDGKGLISDKTKKGYLAAASKLLKQMNLHHNLERPINREVEGILKVEKGHKEGLSIMEVVSVYSVIKGIKKEKKRLQLQALFFLFAFRGLRQMEVQGIRIEHLNFENNTIRFRRKGETVKQTLNANQEVVEDYQQYTAHKCFGRVMRALKEYVNFLGVSKGFLFSGVKTIEFEGKKIRVKDFEKPMRLVSIRKLFTERAPKKTAGLFRLANLPVERSLHGFRHFFGTYLIAKGYSPAEVARLLGHATLDMVMTYYDNHNMGALMERLEKDFDFV